jgi:phenylpyruvate tautomerase PptA (4-oxalocrotonate tautomerase family)
MPYINTKLSTSLSKEKETALKEQFGKAIALIPGKSESWLMLGFEDNCRMYFKGQSSSPLAYVEVNLFGSASQTAYDALTKKLTEILSTELSLNPSNIYIKYYEARVWGWNGMNL